MPNNTDTSKGRLLGTMTCMEPGCGRKFRRWENDSAESFEQMLECHRLRHQLDKIPGRTLRG